MSNECDCGENCTVCEGCGEPMCECECDLDSEEEEEAEEEW